MIDRMGYDNERKTGHIDILDVAYLLVCRDCIHLYVIFVAVEVYF